MIGLLSTRVGIDPGTANTLIYVKGRGVAVNEPSLVTVRRSSGAIEAVGEEAKAGCGRTPRKFQTARPIRGGLISDVKLFDGMLQRFLRKAHVRGSLHRAKVAIAVPSGMTKAERDGVIESIQKTGAIDVFLVDQVLAAARGASLGTEESRGRMVVNIGAGVTEAGIISLGTIVYTHSARVAGDDMDAAIAAHVEAAHQLIIGEPTAERLKIEIGSAVPSDHELTLNVKGRWMRQGIPRQACVRDSEVREAVSSVLQQVVNVIREALVQTPPALSADLFRTGIVLTGGSALLRNLDRLISRASGLPVTVAADPMSCGIRGLAHELNRRDWWRFGSGGL